MAVWPGGDNVSMVKFAGRHIGRIIFKVIIHEEGEFKRIHGEERGTKKEKGQGEVVLFIIFDNLPSLLLGRILVDSLRVFFWPTVGNWKSLFLSWTHGPSHWPGIWGSDKPVPSGLSHSVPFTTRTKSPQPELQIPSIYSAFTSWQNSPRLIQRGKIQMLFSLLSQWQ